MKFADDNDALEAAERLFGAGSPELVRRAGANFSAHPSAVIDSPVEIGDDTQIWHYTHVMDHAKIGSKCTIGQSVHVGPGVVIGDRCAIQNGAQLFTGVALEDDVFIGPCVVFTNVINPRAFVERKQEFRPTIVRRGASIGANATIRCGVTIGEYAMIGAGSVVTKNIGAYELWYGNPAEKRRSVCKCGVTLRKATVDGLMPDLIELPPCKSCGLVYVHSFSANTTSPR